MSFCHAKICTFTHIILGFTNRDKLFKSNSFSAYTSQNFNGENQPDTDRARLGTTVRSMRDLACSNWNFVLKMRWKVNTYCITIFKILKPLQIVIFLLASLISKSSPASE